MDAVADCPSHLQTSALQQRVLSCHIENNLSPDSRYVQTNERMEQFIEYFVKEFEAKLHSYYLILEGESQKSGKFSDTFSGLIGQGVGRAVGGTVGLFFGFPVQGASVLGSAGKLAGEKLGKKLGNKKHENKVVSLYDLIQRSQKDKSNFRKMLVEVGFDIFQSFEMQSMRVSTDKGQKDAVHLLAKDAVNRSINYLKKNKDASISESVILGESKRQALHSISPGFEIKYEYQLTKKTWNTANLYQKVGLLVMQKHRPCFFKKKDSKSETGKYGYRRLFASETWDGLKENFVPDNIAESKSGQFTDYEYTLCSGDMEMKCRGLLEKINSADGRLEEERIKEVLEEVKSDILEEINVLKKHSRGYAEDRKILLNIEANLKDLKMGEFLQIFKQHFAEAKNERENIANCMTDGFKDAKQQRQEIADDNKRKHEITQAGVGKLNRRTKKVRKDQKANKKILEQNKDAIRRVERNQTEVKQTVEETHIVVKRIAKEIPKLVGRQQSKEKSGIWFDMRESVKSFSGRQEQLDQVATHIQQGTVVITGLSGVGKSELAVQHARTKYSRDNNVIWINAESRETTKQSFHKLYKRLGFRIKDEDGAEKDVKSIAEHVYDHLSGRRSLFIFDGAEKFGKVKDLLPLGLPTDVEKPHVLITCNNIEFTGIKALPLGDFTIKESMDFIKENLGITDESQNSEIHELANKKLHNFPLALQQAVAYITEVDKRLKNVNPRKNFTISDYLEEYESKTEELLKCEMFREVGSDYDKTVFTAIHITLSKIRNQEISKEASRILNLMAYFAPDNIPAEVFLELVNSDERELGCAIQLLKDYSIIRHEGLLNMHGLVQQVLRLELKSSRDEGRIVEEKILNQTLGFLKKYMEDYRTLESYVPHIISVWNHANTYDSLIETYIVNNISDKDTHTTYFHVIVEGCPYEVVRHIFNKVEEKFPNELSKIINQESNSGVTPLHSAALSGDERTVRVLLDKGADVNVKTKHKWSPLHFAAKYGYVESVNALIVGGATINAESEYGFSPLHVAAKGGYTSITDVLLDEGADVNLKTNRGFTPLHFAVDNGRIHVVATLLGRGANIEDKTRHEYMPLHLAAKGGHSQIFDTLMESGAHTEPRTRLKFTPLHFAAQNGHLRIVQTLLSQRVAVDVGDANDFTPLHLAALKGHTDIVNVLLDQNADVNAQTTKGNTPLHLAAENAHLSVVKTLITRKAEVDVKNQEGQTVLEIATKGSYEEIIKDYIIGHSQNVDETDTKQDISPKILV